MTAIELAEFLLARIAEDKEAAKRAAFGYGAQWHSEIGDVEDWSVVHSDGKRDMVGCEDGDVTRHIARHNPARVLADCAAKRRIVEAAVPWIASNEERAGTLPELRMVAEEYERTLRALSLPYADHPDYRDEWKP